MEASCYQASIKIDHDCPNNHKSNERKAGDTITVRNRQSRSGSN